MTDRSGIVGMTMFAAALVLAAAIMVPTMARQNPVPEAGPVQVEPLAMVAALPGEQAEIPAGGRPDPLRPRGHRAPGGLTPELIEQCLEVAREVDPALADRLEAIRREQPAEAFARALRDARYLRGLAALKHEDPQLYDVKVKELRLDAKADRLLKQMAEARRTPSEASRELEAKLHEVVQQQVAVSLVARGMYLRRLNEHVKALRDQLEHDLGHFQQAVDRRMKRVLEELDEDTALGAPEG